MFVPYFAACSNAGKSRLFFQITRLFFCYLCAFKSEWFIKLNGELF
jgi:hypothetical protein